MAPLTDWSLISPVMNAPSFAGLTPLRSYLYFRPSSSKAALCITALMECPTG